MSAQSTEKPRGYSTARKSFMQVLSYRRTQVTNLNTMHRIGRPDGIDSVDGGLADDGDSECDHGLIDEDLAAKMMDDLECEWAVALNKDEGDGIEEEEEEEEEGQEE